MNDGLWELLAASSANVGPSIRQGFQQGQERRALGDYAKNPNDPQSLAALMTLNPELGMQAEDRNTQRQAAARQQRAAELAQAREQITITDRLLSGVTDENSFQAARREAEGLGIDVSQVPPSYDPRWVAETHAQARALSERIDRELMAVAPGTSVIDKRTGKPVYTNPDRPRLIPTQPGGGVFNADTGDWAVRPDGVPGSMPHQDINTGETKAVNPQTGETLRYNPKTNQWESMGGASGNTPAPTFP
ncbi:MAG TPA: hypothetical protein VJ859_02960 [Allosphingosinicella sp.]|nr:hypothetical protein [Allosphingosinicella sp.]